MLLGLAFLLPGSAAMADPIAAQDGGAIRLELKPRICTLAADAKACETSVLASWRAPHPESLCLVIVGRPDVKRCWENFAAGTYSIELAFADDLTFQLKDADLRETLATEVLRVIREALHFRHKRRDPWNIFD